MKITQLETFLVVAEELHFRRAAQRLHAQPSSVSTSIRQLEVEFGVTLFRRDSRNVELTPAGEAFRERAAQILESIEEAKRAAQGAGEDQTFEVTVGIQDEGIAELTSVFLANYRARFPNADVRIRDVSYSETETSLLEGRVDILFGVFINHWFRNPEDIISRVLWTEERLVVAASGGPLGALEHIDLDKILRTPHLHLDNVPDVINDFYFNRAIRDVSQSPDVRIMAENMTAILNGAAFSDAVFTVTDGTRRFYHRPDIAYIPAPELTLGHMAAAIRRHDDRPHITALLEETLRTVDSARGLVPSALPVPPGFDPNETVGSTRA